MFLFFSLFCSHFTCFNHLSFLFPLFSLPFYCLTFVILYISHPLLILLHSSNTLIIHFSSYFTIILLSLPSYSLTFILHASHPLIFSPSLPFSLPFLLLFLLIPLHSFYTLLSLSFSLLLLFLLLFLFIPLHSFYTPLLPPSLPPLPHPAFPFSFRPPFNKIHYVV